MVREVSSFWIADSAISVSLGCLADVTSSSGRRMRSDWRVSAADSVGGVADVEDFGVDGGEAVGACCAMRRSFWIARSADACRSVTFFLPSATSDRSSFSTPVDTDTSVAAEEGATEDMMQVG